MIRHCARIRNYALAGRTSHRDLARLVGELRKLVLARCRLRGLNQEPSSGGDEDDGMDMIPQALRAALARAEQRVAEERDRIADVARIVARTRADGPLADDD